MGRSPTVYVCAGAEIGGGRDYSRAAPFADRQAFHYSGRTRHGDGARACCGCRGIPAGHGLAVAALGIALCFGKIVEVALAVAGR